MTHIIPGSEGRVSICNAWKRKRLFDHHRARTGGGKKEGDDDARGGMQKKGCGAHCDLAWPGHGFI